MGKIIVEEKREQQAIVAGQMQSFKTYRVVAIESKKISTEWLVVGDIVIVLPSNWSEAGAMLNTRTGKLMPEGNNADWRSLVKVIRDFKIKSVVLAFDDNEMPA